ncbi:MAG: DNA repair protein RadA [Chitinophagaceae bacterium]|nr:DNA repair protein RadA [Chitinophagaceae bacterium]
MAKSKTTFVCQHCGAESAKWQGKCSSCNSWNSFVEEIVSPKQQSKTVWKEEQRTTQHALPLNEVSEVKTERIQSTDQELNRVLGGGIVPGSVILVAGEPGIGKSTLFLQDTLAMSSCTILYVSGEESLQQIKLRADRIGIKHEHFYLFNATQTEDIFREIKQLKPQLVVIDSIQTLETGTIESAPGSVSQVRECTAEIIRFAKETHTPVFIIGHITKEGTIAGPKVLEHMVDVVLQFEGDRHYAYRIIRATKNRFGAAHELGIYEMVENGLREVSNPSEILITQKEENLSGIAIAATMEGARPLLIEVQALVTQAVYGTPQRTANGFDLRRLQLLLAVLEKRGGFHFAMKDVFLNIAGGLRIEDPAIDLAVLCALLSSYEDRPLQATCCFIGEVGLSGEIRAVNRIEQRIAEAEKLGFEKIYMSGYNKLNAASKHKIEITMVNKIEGLYHMLF